jgi:hypothetical protein
VKLAWLFPVDSHFHHLSPDFTHCSFLHLYPQLTTFMDELSLYLINGAEGSEKDIHAGVLVQEWWHVCAAMFKLLSIYPDATHASESLARIPSPR